VLTGCTCWLNYISMLLQKDIMYGGYLQRGKIFLLLKRVLLILFISFFLPRIGFSQNMPVPENIQAALIPKVLKFSPNHAQKTKLRMLIVYDNNSQISQKELKKAIGTSLDVKSVVEADLEQNIGRMRQTVHPWEKICIRSTKSYLIQKIIMRLLIEFICPDYNNSELFSKKFLKDCYIQDYKGSYIIHL